MKHHKKKYTRKFFTDNPSNSLDDWMKRNAILFALVSKQIKRISAIYGRVEKK